MSFWKTLFGGRGEAKGAAKVSEPVDYNGFILRAAPFQEGGRFQTAGIIEKEIGGVRKEHRFIRADSHASYDAAVEFTLAKARQIVDQMGEHLFN
jgi:hypothetical protein